MGFRRAASLAKALFLIMYNRPSRDPEEVRLQIFRRAEARRKKAKREEFGANLIEVVLGVLVLAIYIFIMTHFIRQ
jgi:hypothetical protein